MSLSDRVAIELGRALVRAITAELQRDEALAKLADAEKSVGEKLDGGT